MSSEYREGEDPVSVYSSSLVLICGIVVQESLGLRTSTKRWVEIVVKRRRNTMGQ